MRRLQVMWMRVPQELRFGLATVWALMTLLSVPTLADGVAGWATWLGFVGSTTASYVFPLLGSLGLAIFVGLTIAESRARRLDAKASTEHMGIAHRPQSPTERLVTMYDEGRRLKQILLISSASVAAEAITGHPPKTRIQFDELTRAWDGKVAACLRSHDDTSFLTTWHSCAALPAAHATLRLIEPSTTLSELREFVDLKIACLKTIIQGLGER